MHSYFHHIGDWMTHTAYCDWMAYAAYHKIMMAYYVSERPMPDDPPAIYRAIGAVTNAEKDATRRALQQFFKLAPDGCWHQKRCDEEIERSRKTSETQRKNINKRWEAKQSAGQLIGNVKSRYDSVTGAILESGNSGLATRPQRTVTDANGRASDTDGISTVIPPLIPTISHEPLNTLNAAAAAVAACERAREAAAAGGIEIKADDPRLAALVADGATPGEFRMAAARATAGGKGVAWLFAAVSGMRQDSASGIAREGPKTGSGSPNYPMLPRWYER